LGREGQTGKKTANKLSDGNNIDDIFRGGVSLGRGKD